MHHKASETVLKYDEQYQVSTTAKTVGAVAWTNAKKAALLSHSWWTGKPLVEEEEAAAAAPSEADRAAVPADMPAKTDEF